MLYFLIVCNSVRYIMPLIYFTKERASLVTCHQDNEAQLKTIKPIISIILICETSNLSATCQMEVARCGVSILIPDPFTSMI